LPPRLGLGGMAGAVERIQRRLLAAVAAAQGFDLLQQRARLLGQGVQLGLDGVGVGVAGLRAQFGLGVAVCGVGQFLRGGVDVLVDVPALV